MQEEHIIKPVKGLSLNLKELWINRELFFFFTWRDIKVKYKQTAIGFAWALLQPLLFMAIFTFFFGKYIKNGSEIHMPYPIFLFSGLILWNLFSNGVLNAGNSMVVNSNIIKKIYFPRLIIPLSSILVSLFDFCITLSLFIILLFYYQASFMAALNVKYRDVRYVLPFLIQIMMFVTPVIYPVSLIENVYVKIIFMINPMSVAIMMFRNIYENQALDVSLVLTSLAVAIIWFFVGLYYFRKTESYFADIA
jgi:lipopolysaccharide transport system permease protein